MFANTLRALGKLCDNADTVLFKEAGGWGKERLDALAWIAEPMDEAIALQVSNYSKEIEEQARTLHSEGPQGVRSDLKVISLVHTARVLEAVSDLIRPDTEVVPPVGKAS